MSKTGRDFGLFLEDILHAISKIEVYTQQLKDNRKEFFRLYDSLQVAADKSASVDTDITEALTAARR